MVKENEKELIKCSTTQLLLNFLHDVIAVNYTAGNEIELKEEDYRRLAKDYVIIIDKKYKKGNNKKVLRT